ncbi:dienelactone hydrolase family protein [Aspergillus lucknowensis]|uniref:Dienelactone hydrolase domain-containing protein n=1 Tax=Aspergillus lucknowensis TaxID=176173 RepID=A0ABR4M4R3_9EURO
MTSTPRGSADRATPPAAELLSSSSSTLAQKPLNDSSAVFSPREPRFLSSSRIPAAFQLRPVHCSSAAMSGVSKACCTIPPIIAKDYQPKGEYKVINGLKTYVTGPETATKAILVVYDIFGFFPQTLQGADILSTSSSQKYRVFIPDFFEGAPADITWFPPQTEEHKSKLGNFFQTKAAPPNTLSKIPGVVAEANALAPTTAGGSFESWSILGYCWGGKITVLASGAGGENTLFKAAVQCHPAMLDPNDAKSVTIPMALLASKDEKPADVSAFGANLKTDHYVETFATQIHGWMAARSDLYDEEVRKEYERGYKTALDFLGKHA